MNKYTLKKIELMKKKKRWIQILFGVEFDWVDGTDSVGLNNWSLLMLMRRDGYGVSIDTRNGLAE